MMTTTTPRIRSRRRKAQRRALKMGRVLRRNRTPVDLVLADIARTKPWLQTTAIAWPSDGTPADIQAISNDDASPGDTITLPGTPASPQSFTWTSGVSILAGVHLQGGGSGRVIARSVGEQTVGTGTKTFILAVSTKLPWFEAQKDLIVPGMTLRAERTGGEVGDNGNATGNMPYMIGTVTSYNSGTNELVMNMTSSGEAGTHVRPIWIISTIPATKILKNFSGDCVTHTESTTHNSEISGIHFDWLSGSGDYIQTYPTSGGLPFFIHDLYMKMVGEPITDGMFGYDSQAVHGLIWNCSFVARWMANNGQGIRVQTDAAYGSIAELNAWVVASTMGTNDSTGLTNMYIETCDFHGLENGTDLSDNSRTVVRNCMFNNASTATHGPDTGIFGQRHIEVYANEFVFNGFANGQSLPLNYFVYFRGGTGVVTDNILPDIYSTDFQARAQITLQIQNLERNAGPNGFWGDNIGVSTVSAASVANPTVITTTGAHGLTTGMYVRIKDSDSTPTINGRHQVTVTDTTHFTIAVNVTVAATTGSVKRIYYSCPRQVGMGNLTYPSNSGVDGKGRSTDPNVGLGWPGTYVGDLEPVYFWDNTGGTVPLPINITGGTNDPGPPATYPDTPADYIRESEQYYPGTAKPGWVAYPYPNPNIPLSAGDVTINVTTLNVGTANGPS